MYALVRSGRVRQLGGVLNRSEGRPVPPRRHDLLSTRPPSSPKSRSFMIVDHDMPVSAINTLTWASSSARADVPLNKICVMARIAQD